MPKRYTTLDDVKRNAIIPTLDKADEYDVDAIADATYAWRVDLDADGNEVLNTAGFEQVVDTDAYWAAVQRYVHSKEIVLPVRFYLKDPTSSGIERLKARAVVVDQDAGNSALDESYSIAQAVTVILHNDPDDLFKNWLIGWSVETPWDEMEKDGD